LLPTIRQPLTPLPISTSAHLSVLDSNAPAPPHRSSSDYLKHTPLSRSHTICSLNTDVSSGSKLLVTELSSPVLCSNEHLSAQGQAYRSTSSPPGPSLPQVIGARAPHRRLEGFQLPHTPLCASAPLFPKENNPPQANPAPCRRSVSHTRLSASLPASDYLLPAPESYALSNSACHLRHLEHGALTVCQPSCGRRSCSHPASPVSSSSTHNSKKLGCHANVPSGSAAASDHTASQKEQGLDLPCDVASIHVASSPASTNWASDRVTLRQLHCKPNTRPNSGATNSHSVCSLSSPVQAGTEPSKIKLRESTSPVLHTVYQGNSSEGSSREKKHGCNSRDIRGHVEARAVQQEPVAQSRPCPEHICKDVTIVQPRLEGPPECNYRHSMTNADQCPSATTTRSPTGSAIQDFERNSKLDSVKDGMHLSKTQSRPPQQPALVPVQLDDIALPKQETARESCIPIDAWSQLRSCNSSGCQARAMLTDTCIDLPTWEGCAMGVPSSLTPLQESVHVGDRQLGSMPSLHKSCAGPPICLDMLGNASTVMPLPSGDRGPAAAHSMDVHQGEPGDVSVGCITPDLHCALCPSRCSLARASVEVHGGRGFLDSAAVCVSLSSGASAATLSPATRSLLNALQSLRARGDQAAWKGAVHLCSRLLFDST
jgi:hypothetical protein